MRNKVQLIGNLAATPELKEINGHGKVVNVSMATNESYKNAKGEWVKETTWHSLVMWNGMADKAVKILEKGAEILVEGKISNRTYEDKEGIKRYVSEIMVNDFILLNTKVEKQLEANP